MSVKLVCVWRFPLMVDHCLQVFESHAIFPCPITVQLPDSRMSQHLESLILELLVPTTQDLCDKRRSERCEHVTTEPFGMYDPKVIRLTIVKELCLAYITMNIQVFEVWLRYTLV